MKPSAMNPDSLMVETALGYGQLELRLHAFVAAQAAGYDLVERGTGRRILTEPSIGVEQAVTPAGASATPTALAPAREPAGKRPIVPKQRRAARHG